MTKKRILFTTEFTHLNTGYANYYRELMKELSKDDSLQLFELASYAHAHQHAQQIAQTPWKVYPNMPVNDQEEQMYNSSPVNEFGAWKLESVCLDCLPHAVCSIKDAWMDQHIDTSAFRKCYKTVFMPTVDARCQNLEWLDFYKRSDFILTYTGWSKEVLDEESNGQINTVGVGDYAVSPEKFKLIKDKAAHKESMGIKPESIIIGMVARNQKRKLYPELANAFIEFLKKLDYVGTENVYLYWHTAYPDLGWNIPDLVLNNGLSHKVLFTYNCMQCQHFFPSFYRDTRTACPKCKSGNVILANSQQGVTEENLSNIYNLFDLYVQYVSNEGFGLPQVEAAMCGVPVAGTNYSAMEEIIPRLGGYLVNPQNVFKEVETGRFMVWPDNNQLANIIKDFVALPEAIRGNIGEKTRRLAVKYYGSWAKVADNWRVALDKVAPDDTLWSQLPQIVNVPPEMLNECNQITEEQFTNWLFINVLQEPRLINSYIGLKVYRDLLWGRTNTNNLGLFSNDMSLLGGRPSFKPFTKSDAYQMIKQYREVMNHWEKQRWGRIQQLGQNNQCQ